MAKSKSKRQSSISTNESFDDEHITDWSPAYTLQKHNICLQDAQRQMTKEIINILSKSSKEVKKWQTKWHRFAKSNKKNLTKYENMWEVFDAAISFVDVFMEDIDEKIENLQSVQSSMPTEKKQQSLEDEIKQAGSPVNKLSRRIADQKNKATTLQRQMEQLSIGSRRSTLRNTIFRTSQKNPKERLKNVVASIDVKNTLLENERSEFNREAERIFDEYKTTELHRTRLMKRHLTSFVDSFGQASNEFKGALKSCKPEKDLNEWEQTILRQNSQQLDEGSDEEENSNTKKYSLRQPIQSRSTKNGNRDKKTNPPFNSVKSVPVGNVSSNKKKLLYQSSVQPASVVNKKRDKKTNKHQESSEFSPAEWEEIDNDD